MHSPEPRFARIASVIGDPTRARMLSALLAGRFLSAGELAAMAGVTAATASAHIAKLVDAGLLVTRRQGRHHYLGLADAEIAHALEALSLVAERDGADRRWSQGAYKPLKAARTCYRHLAGELGVALLDGLLARGTIAPESPRRQRSRGYRPAVESVRRRLVRGWQGRSQARPLALRSRPGPDLGERLEPSRRHPDAARPRPQEGLSRKGRRGRSRRRPARLNPARSWPGHDPAVVETADLGFRQAERTGENFVGVLAERRRRQRWQARHILEVERRGGGPVGRPAGVGDGREHRAVSGDPRVVGRGLAEGPVRPP